MHAKGIIIRHSRYSVKETIDILERFLVSRGATIYIRIDQQNEVHKSGADLLPIEFILFGNPKAGGPLMAKNPLLALDLPLKIIAWEDEQKKVWLACNEARYIEDRYSLTPGTGSALILDGLIDLVLKKEH